MKFVFKHQFIPAAINLVNGISVNGLGEASMDLGHSMMNATNLIGLSTSGTPPPSGNPPNIHPGCILSTGRINSGQAQMPQNLVFAGNGVQPTANGAGGQQQQQQQNFMAGNMTNGGAMSNSNNMKFNNHQPPLGSLQHQQQTYMHHN